MVRLADTRRDSVASRGRRLLEKLRTSDKGFAMVLTLFVIIIISMLALSMMMVAAYQYKDASRTKPSTRAFDLAQAGISYGCSYLAQDNVPDPAWNSSDQTLGATGSKFNVTVTTEAPASSHIYKIVSSGTYTSKEGTGVNRDYVRRLEERVQYGGSQGHFDAFNNYVLFSKNGDISMSGGWNFVNASNLTVDGSIYGKDVTVYNHKTALAGGTISVTGNVYATGDVSLSADSTVAAYSGVNIGGSVRSGGSTTVYSKVAFVAGAGVSVGKDIDAAESVTVQSDVGAASGGGASVGGAVNALGDVLVRAYAGALADSGATVSGEVKSGGSVNVQAQDGFVTGTTASTGKITAVVDANVSAQSSTWSGLQATTGAISCNGSSSLYSDSWWAAGAAYSKVNVGTWTYGGTRGWHEGNDYFAHDGRISKGAESHSNPGNTAPTIQTVPDVELPEPDWNWYRTMAVAQGHSHIGAGPYTNQNITANPDHGSSGEIYYYDDDVTTTNLIINPSTKGVIVCKGDVTVSTTLQINSGAEYQIICTGDIKFETSLNLNIFANDTVFFYTDGTHMHGGTKRNGDVTYDLGWFRDLYGQITCAGNINTPMAGFIRDALIRYKAPSVPVAAWPIPMSVLTFREL
jgi:hypothetical protein